MDTDEQGRTTLQNLVEGLIVLAAVVVGVVIVVAIAD
jgi:heme/copper-type cytochrome/quinol oxidase subunit 4